jgi:hypothetical protein
MPQYQATIKLTIDCGDEDMATAIAQDISDAIPVTNPDIISWLEDIELSNDGEHEDEEYPCEFSGGYRCGNCSNCHRAEGANK